MSSRVFVVLCPFPDGEQALSAARILVEEGLAACAQCASAPVTSIYRWEGKLCEESERMLLLKTSRESWPSLRDRLAELHPYDVPEVLACPVDGNEAYLDWVEKSCTPPADGV